MQMLPLKTIRMPHVPCRIDHTPLLGAASSCSNFSHKCRIPSIPQRGGAGGCLWLLKSSGAVALCADGRIRLCTAAPAYSFGTPSAAGVAANFPPSPPAAAAKAIATMTSAAGAGAEAGAHSGLMHCHCGHNSGRVRFPLDGARTHLNGKCVWECCGLSWERMDCSIPAGAAGGGRHTGRIGA